MMRTAFSSLNSLSTNNQSTLNVVAKANSPASAEVSVLRSLSVAKKTANPQRRLKRRLWNSLSNSQILPCLMRTITAAVHPLQIIPTASQKFDQKSDIPQQRYCWYVQTARMAAMMAMTRVTYHEFLSITFRPLCLSIFTFASFLLQTLYLCCSLNC
jgi:hypothetical protein